MQSLPRRLIRRLKPLLLRLVVLLLSLGIHLLITLRLKSISIHWLKAACEWGHTRILIQTSAETRCVQWLLLLLVVITWYRRRVRFIFVRLGAVVLTLNESWLSKLSSTRLCRVRILSFVTWRQRLCRLEMGLIRFLVIVLWLLWFICWILLLLWWKFDALLIDWRVWLEHNVNVELF